jgi:tRNA (adenine-N(1)-)-methyltransferase non-catalytic subunit
MDILSQFNLSSATKGAVTSAPLAALLQCYQQSRQHAEAASETANIQAQELGAAESLVHAQEAAQPARPAGKDPAEMVTSGSGGTAAHSPAAGEPFRGPDNCSAARAAGRQAAQEPNGSNLETRGTAAEAITEPQATARSQGHASSSDRLNGASLPAAVQQACSLGFTSCLIACPGVQPLALVRRLLPLLAPSAALVVFSNWLQPLADCMLALQVRLPLVGKT